MTPPVFRQLVGEQYANHLRLKSLDLSSLRVWEDEASQVVSTMEWSAGTYNLSLLSSSQNSLVAALQVTLARLSTPAVLHSRAGQVVLGPGEDTSEPTWRLFTDPLGGDLLVQKWQMGLNRYVTHMTINESGGSGGGTTPQDKVYVGSAPNARWRLSSDETTGHLMIEKWDPTGQRFVLQMDIAPHDPSG